MISLSAKAEAQTLDYGRFEKLFGEPVTTTATGSPQRAGEVPADIAIVTADDIRRSGAKDLPGVLRHVTGIDVQQWGNSDADVTVRGYRQPYSPRLLVLVNGRQVYLDHFGFTQWSAIPVQLEEIRQIEVVKGPNSALFGFNAAGGVVNIVTYNPLYDDVNVASVAGGTQDYRQGSAVGMARLGDRLGVKLSAGGNTGDEFSRQRQLMGSLGLPQRTERSSVGMDAQLRLDNASILEFEATHVTANQFDLTTGYIPAYAKYEVNSLMGRYSAETQIGVVQATAYTNFSEQNVRLASLDGPADFRNQVTVAQIQDLFSVGTSHTFRVSGEFRRNEVNTAPVGGGTICYEIGSASGMWEWRVLPRLSLTQALRIDHLSLGRSGSFPPILPFINAAWNRSFTEPSFNIGAVYKASEDDTLRLTAARGLQLPSLLEFGGIVGTHGPGVVVTGNPGLSSTVITNYELGWEHQLLAIGGLAKASAFYQTNDNLQNQESGTLLFSPTTGVPITLADNVGNSREIGAELSIKGAIGSDWRWGVSYSPRFITDRFKANQPSTATSLDFRATSPRHVVDASIGWSRGKWEIDSFVRYQSGSAGFNLTNVGYVLDRVGAYGSLDARIGYRLSDRVTLSVSGQNLATETQRQTSVGSVDRSVLGRLTAGF